MKRVLDSKVLGKLHHIEARAYGPVVLRQTGSTWRSSKSEGGGCLYDYAIHAIDLINYLVGSPQAVGGAILKPLFSRDVEDQVCASLYFSDGLTGNLAANWSDASHRKMSAVVTVWGEKGSVSADRQEIRIFLRDNKHFEALSEGWTVRNTTELTQPVWFYLRGEEYSSQIDHFVQAIASGDTATRCTFRAAVEADLIAAAIAKNAERGQASLTPVAALGNENKSSGGLWSAFIDRLNPAGAGVR
jgi:scyllo-inositol 2-dehydrogenase (NADP+)